MKKYISPYIRWARGHQLLLSILVVGLLIKISFISKPMEELITYQKDDAYFYYEIARNIAQGNGVTISAGIETNGFHPLYLIILTPLYLLFYRFGINMPIYVNFVLFTLLSVVTTIFIYKITNRLTNRSSGLIASALWMLNPYVLRNYLTGMEAPIQVFFLSVLTFYWVKYGYSGNFTYKRQVIIGVILGLLFLSRMDMAFVAIGLALSIILWGPTANNFVCDNNYISRFLIVFVIALVSLVVSLPWFIYSFFSLGRLTPISGEARKIAGSPETITSTPGSIQTLLKFIDAVVSTIFALNYEKNILISVIIAVTVILLISIPIIYVLKYGFGDMISTVTPLNFLILSSLLYYPYYILYLGQARHYYNLYTSFLVVILVSIFVGIVMEKVSSEYIPKLIYMVITSMIILSLVFGGVPLYTEGGNNSGMETHMNAALHVDNHLPDNASIASYFYSSGTMQYYTYTHDIIILDPYINPASLNYHRQNNMYCYIETDNFTHIFGSTTKFNGSKGTNLWHEEHEINIIKTWSSEIGQAYHPIFETRGQTSGTSEEVHLREIKHKHSMQNNNRYC